MQAGKFNFWHGLNGIKIDKVVHVLADGTELVSRDQLYLIKTDENHYRGIDERFDTEAIEFLKGQMK